MFFSSFRCTHPCVTLWRGVKIGDCNWLIIVPISTKSFIIASEGIFCKWFISGDRPSLAKTLMETMFLINKIVISKPLCSAATWRHKHPSLSLQPTSVPFSKSRRAILTSLVWVAISRVVSQFLLGGTCVHMQRQKVEVLYTVYSS